MLENKRKTFKDFNNFHKYYTYLRKGKKLKDFNYNTLLKHTHPINQKARKKYQNYKIKLLEEIKNRLKKEFDNSLIDRQIKKEYFFDEDPLDFKIEKKPASIFDLKEKATNFYNQILKLAENKFNIKKFDKCPVCKGKNRIFLKEQYNNRESLVLCPHLYKKIIPTTNIKKRFKDKGYSDFMIEEENQTAYNALKEYKENFDIVLNNGESLLLIGDVGTGKTHLAIATILDLTYKPTFYYYKLISKKYISLPIFLNDLKTSKDERLLKYYSESTFLVIDDLGIENLNNWAREKVFTLVNKRYQSKLPTLFISDLSPVELVEKLDKRIMSRLHEMARGVVIGGEDKRKQLEF